MSNEDSNPQQEIADLKEEVIRLRERMSGMIPAIKSNNYQARIGSKVVPVFVAFARAEMTEAEIVAGVVLEEIGSGLPHVAALFHSPVVALQGDAVCSSLDFAYVVKPDLDENVAKIRDGNRLHTPVQKVA